MKSIRIPTDKIQGKNIKALILFNYKTYSHMIQDYFFLKESNIGYA